MAGSGTAANMAPFLTGTNIQTLFPKFDNLSATESDDPLTRGERPIVRTSRTMYLPMKVAKYWEGPFTITVGPHGPVKTSQTYRGFCYSNPVLLPVGVRLIAT